MQYNICFSLTKMEHILQNDGNRNEIPIKYVTYSRSHCLLTMTPSSLGFLDIESANEARALFVSDFSKASQTSCNKLNDVCQFQLILRHERTI